MRRSILLVVLLVSALCASSALGSLQDKAPSKPNIPWELDRDGLRQWTKVEVECETCKAEGIQDCLRCKSNANAACAECNKKHEATCRSCGGDKKQYNPLEEMICPFCDGSGLWECPACHGDGSYGVVGGGKKDQDCGPCKEKGSLKCGVCKGRRSVAVVKPPGGLPKASMTSLDDTLEDLELAMTNLKAFKPRGNESEDRKAFGEAIKKAKSKLPAFKTLGKMMDGSMKALRGQAGYVGYEKWVASEFKKFRVRSIAYIQSQQALIEVCRERHEFNETVR